MRALPIHTGSCLNAWSPGGGTVCEGLAVALLEEVCCGGERGWALNC